MDIFWLVAGGGGWWWMVIGVGEYILVGGGCWLLVVNGIVGIFWLVYVKSVRIRSLFSPYFPVLGLNTEINRVILNILSYYGKIRARKTPNLNTFQVVLFLPCCQCCSCLNKIYNPCGSSQYSFVRDFPLKLSPGITVHSKCDQILRLLQKNY